MAAAKLREPRATYIALSLDPDVTLGRMRAILGSVGVHDLALAADPNARIMTGFGVLTVGTTR